MKHLHSRSLLFFAPPYHPYTEALLSAVPIADPHVERKRIVLEGESDPKNFRLEGPFAEYTGYYTDELHKVINKPALEVKQILHRNKPVLWATGQGRPVTDVHMLLAFTRAATLRTELEQMKIPVISSVCVMPESAGRFWARGFGQADVSGPFEPGGERRDRQQHRLLRHQGHHHGRRGHHGRRPAARDVGLVLPLRPGARHRHPEARPLDAARPGPRSGFEQAHTSRIIMDACIPYEWKQKPVEAGMDEEMLAKIKGRWAEYGID